MEIIVLGKKIDTKQIVDIRDIEYGKQMFLDREAGFVITFMDGSKIAFREDIPYESYPRKIASIKDKWEKLQQEVTEQWEKDKHDLPVFGFDSNK